MFECGGRDRNPRRSYSLALAIVVPLSMAVYFFPHCFHWPRSAIGRSEHRLPSTAAKLIEEAGRFLITVAAMIANVSLLNATVLTSTRMPSAMAEDGYLPARFAAKHPKFGTPWIAILISSTIYALLAFHTLAQLLTVYVWLRTLVTVLTVLSAWRIRKKFPEMKRHS
jgi:amino acid transporter